jgi:hypothetical protein
MQNGEICFFFLKLKKNKTSLPLFPKPFWQFVQRRESSATTVMAEEQGLGSNKNSAVDNQFSCCHLQQLVR